MSASTISRIPEGAEQKRNMIMLGWIVHVKCNRHVRIKSPRRELLEIRSGLEGQPILAALQFCSRRKQGSHTAIRIGGAFADLLPAGGGPLFQQHRDPSRRTATGRVENVG